MWESVSNWFGAQGFNAQMALWSVAIATGGFVMGGVTHDRLRSAERSASAQGEAGDAEGAIRALSQANSEARATLQSGLRAGYADARDRDKGHFAALNEASGELELDEMSRRVTAVTEMYEQHRSAARSVYMRTLRRERLQLEAMSKTWGPEGRALADVRIAELKTIERQVEDLLIEDTDGEGVEDALAVNTAPAPVDEDSRSPEDSPNLGFNQALANLTADPDTVATAVAQPDTVAFQGRPLLALAEEQPDTNEGSGRPTIDMELGVGASD